jgi:hypothetical protein
MREIKRIVAAARELTMKCRVPHATLPLPIGLEASDQFILELSKYNGGYVPQEITDERGRFLVGRSGPIGQSQSVAVDCRYPAAIRRYRHAGQKVPETHARRG